MADPIRLGWSVGGASPPQAELLVFLQRLKLLQYKNLLLSRGFTVAREFSACMLRQLLSVTGVEGLLELSSQELVALGMVSETALERLATVRQRRQEGLPAVCFIVST